MGLQEGVVEFSVEISQSASMNDKVEAGGEGSASVGWGMFKLNISAKASYSRETARKTDTRARQNVKVTEAPQDPPEAVSQVLEMLRETSLSLSIDLFFKPVYFFLPPDLSSFLSSGLGIAGVTGLLSSTLSLIHISEPTRPY